MRRVWVFALIAVLAVSAIVAGSAGYLYLSGGEAGDVPESEIPEDVYTGPEDLNTSDGNVSSLGWLCGGGSTDAYGNYSPRSYEDYEYELANSSDGPTEERYVNVYEPGEPPKWIPESEFSMENHSAGTYEVTRYPNAEPTEEQIDAAWRLYNRSFEAAKENGWFEFDEAVEDGYRMEGANRHWVNVDNLTIHTEENQLNPQYPETLVYYQDPNDEDNRILAGYMYHQPLGTNIEGEQIAGPVSVWHYHPLRTANYPAYIKEFADMRGMEEEEFLEKIGAGFESAEEFAEERDRTAEMMHVWFVEHPESPFATSMSVPSQVLKEPEKMSEEEFKEYVMASR
jgi:hypothetical protein